MDNQTQYIVAFRNKEGDEGLGLESFLKPFIDKMIAYAIPVTGHGTYELDLGKYEDVCKFSHMIKVLIEGFGYRKEGNYDLLSNDEASALFEKIGNVSFVQQDDYQHLKGQYVDVDKLIDKKWRMPRSSRPLKHAQITLFNQWIDAGMPEHADGPKWEGEIFPARNSRYKQQPSV